VIEGVDPHPLGATDAGADRELSAAARTSLCLARMPGGVWCTRERGHEATDAMHLGPEPRKMPAPGEATRLGRGEARNPGKQLVPG
jgi:hypothetical protein